MSASSSGKTSPNKKPIGEDAVKYPVDVWEWSYEPKKKSSKTVQDEGTNFSGALTFRVWNFSGLTVIDRILKANGLFLFLFLTFKQEEAVPVQQYFYTRRALYIVMWKVTDGELALNEIYEWLLLIQVSTLSWSNPL